MSINNKTYSPLGYFSIKAGEDLSPNIFVGFDGNLTSPETKSLGVTDSKWVMGEFASVITIGIAFIETVEAVAVGDKLTTSTSGKAKKASGSMPVNGRALDTITAPGFVRILLTT